MRGTYRHRVFFQNPTQTPDGHGGYTEAWTDLAPAAGWKVSISPASPQDLERLAAGTVISQGTNIVRGAYHPGVTTATRMLFVNRQGVTEILKIAGTSDPDRRGITMELLAVELREP